MGKMLYLECFGGISGDMAVAALLDLGADEAILRKALGSLPVGGFEVAVSRVKKAGLDMCDFRVCLERDNHDHDMEWLHGGAGDHHVENDVAERLKQAGSDGSLGGSDAHGEGLGGGSHVHHHHVHRGLPEILRIIEAGEMSGRAKETAARIFTILAQAEARAHGVAMEEVHFHEVGAVDSIVDIVAVAVCLDNLGISEAVASPLYEGIGTVRCQHGLLPVPVPAVVNIAAAHGLTLHRTEIEGELVTPTGAAIVAAIRTADRLPEGFVVKKAGMGAGKRDYQAPGFLRAMLLEPAGEQEDVICKLETNIDDCSGEALGYVMERLFAAGARDVHYMPVFMKKNRPAWQLNVICKKEDTGKLEQIIFAETTTIGIRRFRAERSVLERRFETVETVLGPANVKVCRLPDGTRRYYPEYESVAALARESGMPFQEVYELVRGQR